MPIAVIVMPASRIPCAREMLRTRPAITAADGVKSTATYTDVPEFGFRAARLTVHFIASGDFRWGRFWGSITCFMFSPEGRAMETRLSYVLRPRSQQSMFTLPCAPVDVKSLAPRRWKLRAVGGHRS